MSLSDDKQADVIDAFNPFTAIYNARNTPGENTAILMLLLCYI